MERRQCANERDRESSSGTQWTPPTRFLGNPRKGLDSVIIKNRDLFQSMSESDEEEMMKLSTSTESRDLNVRRV